VEVTEPRKSAERGRGFEWQETERAILRAEYRNQGAKAIAKLLPNRSVSAIYAEADRLGLVTRRGSVWIDCRKVALKLGLFSGRCTQQAAISFFEERQLALRRKVTGEALVSMASLARWIAGNPPEFDLKRVNQAWFVKEMLRS
jgi:hypothetical protein